MELCTNASVGNGNFSYGGSDTIRNVVAGGYWSNFCFNAIIEYRLLFNRKLFDTDS